MLVAIIILAIAVAFIVFDMLDYHSDHIILANRIVELKYEIKKLKEELETLKHSSYES